MSGVNHETSDGNLLASADIILWKSQSQTLNRKKNNRNRYIFESSFASYTKQ